ncbi:MAG: hypothetical protein O7G87_11340 [bacterium]|nr:hypothetical protein [bacterium]
MATITTFEGVVENGQIRLDSSVRLPDKTKVYVVVPEFEGQVIPRISSPRLVHPEQAVDFKKEVVETPSNADL